MDKTDLDAGVAVFDDPYQAAVVEARRLAYAPRKSYVATIEIPIEIRVEAEDEDAAEAAADALFERVYVVADGAIVAAVAAGEIPGSVRVLARYDDTELEEAR